MSSPMSSLKISKRLSTNTNNGRMICLNLIRDPKQRPGHIHGGHCQQRCGSRPKRSCIRQNGVNMKIPTRICALAAHRRRELLSRNCQLYLQKFDDRSGHCRVEKQSKLIQKQQQYVHLHWAHFIPTAINNNTISNSKPATESQFAAHNNKLNGCAAHNCCALRPFRTDSETYRSSPFCGFAVYHWPKHSETAVCVMNE
jgi:hypothetical protein